MTPHHPETNAAMPPDRPPEALPAALATALAAARRDQTPLRDLWADIEARIAQPALAVPGELPPPLAAALAAQRVDAAPTRDLWPAIAARTLAADDGADLAPALRASLAALAADVPPQRDLWPGITARIAPPVPVRRRRLTRWTAGVSLAASLLVAIGIATERRPAVDSDAAHAPLRPSADVLAAMASHEHAADDVNALRHASLRPIPREQRALVRANLKIVDSARTQIQQAMAADPDDAAYLQALLDSAHTQQQELRAALAERP